MKYRVLLDLHLAGKDVFLRAGLRESGWADLVTLEFLRLRDVGLPDDCSDQDIWRFVQQHRMVLLTSNRNCDDETSLQATIRRENTLDALPIVTVPDPDRLLNSAYRQDVVVGLIEIFLCPEEFCGRGRMFIS